MTYTATIRHHSISRARTVSATTLLAAKRAATKEFGGEFRDYEIVIFHNDEIVARRRVSDRRWQETEG